MTGERHGTHIASTILQFVPKARIVFAGGIMDSYAKLESMLEWVSQFKIDVLNLSLAFPEKDEKVMILFEPTSRMVELMQKKCPEIVSLS